MTLQETKNFLLGTLENEDLFYVYCKEVRCPYNKEDLSLLKDLTKMFFSELELLKFKPTINNSYNLSEYYKKYIHLDYEYEDDDWKLMKDAMIVLLPFFASKQGTISFSNDEAENELEFQYQNGKLNEYIDVFSKNEKKYFKFKDRDGERVIWFLSVLKFFGFVSKIAIINNTISNSDSTPPILQALFSGLGFVLELPETRELFLNVSEKILTYVSKDTDLPPSGSIKNFCRTLNWNISPKKTHLRK